MRWTAKLGFGLVCGAFGGGRSSDSNRELSYGGSFNGALPIATVTFYNAAPISCDGPFEGDAAIVVDVADLTIALVPGFASRASRDAELYGQEFDAPACSHLW